MSKVKVTGAVHWFLKVQSYHKNWTIEKFQISFIDTLLDETIQTRASREMTSQKIRQYLTLTCKTPIPRLLILIKLSIKIQKIWQSNSPVLLIFSISVPNLVTIGRHLTFNFWRVRCLTCNNSMAYLKNWTDNFFQIFFIGTYWVAVSINNITTRASREMTSRKNI